MQWSGKGSKSEISPYPTYPPPAMTGPIAQPTARLTAEQRRAIDAGGTPLTLVDEHDGAAYVLLAPELIPDPELGGFTARVPGIPAYGEGETERAAVGDLLDALTMILDGDETRSPNR